MYHSPEQVKGNITERKLFQDSKKKASISAENQDGKENKCKPVTNSKKCSSSHTNKPAAEKSSNVSCSKFARVASAKFGLGDFLETFFFGSTIKS